MPDIFHTKCGMYLTSMAHTLYSYECRPAILCENVNIIVISAHTKNTNQLPTTDQRQEISFNLYWHTFQLSASWYDAKRNRL